MGLEDVSRLENEVARALVEHRAFVLASQPVKDRETDAHQRDLQPFRRLPAMRMRHEQMRAGGHLLEIAEIADMHDIGRHLLQDGRRAGCGDGRDDFGSQAGEESRKLVKMIRLGGDGDALAAEMEMPVQQCVLQLRPPPADGGGNRATRKLAKQRHETVGHLHARQRVELGEGQAAFLVQGFCRPAHMLADRNDMRTGAEFADILDGGPTIGGGYPFVRHRAVERA